jgi:hypothetical protein
MPHRPHSRPSARRRRLASRAPAIFILALLAFAALAMSAAAWLATTSIPGKAAQGPPASIPPGQNYVRRVRLWPELQRLFAPLGNRLATPGLERMTLIGTLTRPAAAKINLPARLILEFPYNLRLEEQDGNKLHILVFNGQALARPGDAVKPSDQADVESLVFDSAERFFLGQMQGQATRFLGSRFRLDDGTAEHYPGPYYDVYEVSDQIELGNSPPRQQTKLYYFNSDTLRLEKVRYRTNRSGPIINAEVQFSDWQNIGGQLLPGRITRAENGVTLLDFKAASFALSPRTGDGVFNQ